MMQVKASVRKHMPHQQSLSIHCRYAFARHLEAWVTRTRDNADPLTLDEEVGDGINHRFGEAGNTVPGISEGSDAAAAES